MFLSVSQVIFVALLMHQGLLSLLARRALASMAGIGASGNFSAGTFSVSYVTAPNQDVAKKLATLGVVDQAPQFCKHLIYAEVAALLDCLRYHWRLRFLTVKMETGSPKLALAAPLVPTSGAAGPWLHQDLIVPRTFGGKSGEDVDAWLTHCKWMSKYYQRDAVTQLSNVVCFLTDTALVWYENHQDALTSWDRFVSEVRPGFGDSVAKRKQAEQTLLQRAQIPGETCTTYIEAILNLCKIVNPSMSEEDKVGHLLKGIAKDVYQFLISKESLGTVTDVISSDGSAAPKDKCCSMLPQTVIFVSDYSKPAPK